jgi:hypothetical protein
MIMSTNNGGREKIRSTLSEWLRSAVVQLREFAADQLKAFLQTLYTLGVGFWRMLVGLLQIMFLVFYMLVLILPQLLVYSLAIAVLWPVAKLEELALRLLNKIATSLSKAIRSLRTLTNNIMALIETMNRDLRDISFLPKPDTSDSDSGMESEQSLDVR